VVGAWHWPPSAEVGIDHLAPKLKKEQRSTATPSLDLCGLFWGKLYLYLYLLYSGTVCRWKI